MVKRTILFAGLPIVHGGFLIHVLTILFARLPTGLDDFRIRVFHDRVYIIIPWRFWTGFPFLAISPERTRCAKIWRKGTGLLMCKR